MDRGSEYQKESCFMDYAIFKIMLITGIHSKQLLYPVIWFFWKKTLHSQKTTVKAELANTK